MQRAVSHNVTHKYTEGTNRSVRMYSSRARANVTGFPGSLYLRSRASPFPTSVRDHTENDGSLTANLLIKPETSSLSRKRSPPFV